MGLVQMAAQRLNRPAAELMLANGTIGPKGAGASITIAELIGGKRTAFKMDMNAPLKAAAEYSIVGQPVLRPDVPGKVTGRHTYVQDHSVPGMLQGRVIRATAPVAAALANAVFDATGKLLTQVPFTAERVKAALW
jgi:hypothetical protein